MPRVTSSARRVFGDQDATLPNRERPRPAKASSPVGSAHTPRPSPLLLPRSSPACLSCALTATVPRVDTCATEDTPETGHGKCVGSLRRDVHTAALCGQRRQRPWGPVHGLAPGLPPALPGRAPARGRTTDTGLQTCGQGRGGEPRWGTRAGAGRCGGRPGRGGTEGADGVGAAARPRSAGLRGTGVRPGSRGRGAANPPPAAGTRAPASHPLAAPGRAKGRSDAPAAATGARRGGPRWSRAGPAARRGPAGRRAGGGGAARGSWRGRRRAHLG